MFRLSRFLVFVAVVASLAPVAFSSPVAEPETKEVNVLMGPQEEWCQGMKQEFEKKTGITVNYVRMSSGEALARIRAEKANPQFDIWWGGPIDSFIAAKQEGLLEAYNSPNYANLLDQKKFKDADNTWVGIYVGSLGFCTNSNWLAAHPGARAPESWADLLKPEFKNQITVAHPSTSGTSYTALATVLQLMGEAKGWEYLKALSAQVHQFTKTGAAPAKFVGQGEDAVGIVFSHDTVNEIENSKLPLVLTFPKDGTGFEIGGMGMIKGGKNVANARKWFDWAISPEAEALGPKYKAYQAPTVKGVQTSHPELLQVNLIDYDFQWAGKNKKAFVDKFTNEIAAAANLR